MSKASGVQIYQRIKQLTEIRKISIKDLANKVGFKSPSTIYNYKYNVTPGKASLNAIADALNTTPEYLLGETDDWQKHEQVETKRLNLDELKDDTVLATLNGKELSDSAKKRYYALLKALDETDNNN